MKAGIAIGLQNAAVMGEMPLGMIAAAIDLRRNTPPAVDRGLIADIGP
jgi:hypothetical protein